MGNEQGSELTRGSDDGGNHSSSEHTTAYTASAPCCCPHTENRDAIHAAAATSCTRSSSASRCWTAIFPSSDPSRNPGSTRTMFSRSQPALSNCQRAGTPGSRGLLWWLQKRSTEDWLSNRMTSLNCDTDCIKLVGTNELDGIHHWVQ